MQQVREKQHEGRDFSHTPYELLNLGALDFFFVDEMFHLYDKLTYFTSEAVKFVMSIWRRKLAPSIRHCWAFRMMICLIKSNTNKQQYPVTLLTHISNVGARKYHINIESEVRIRAFPWPGLTTVRRAGVGQVNRNSLLLACQPVTWKWRSA